jgi:hypothetical protein
MAAEDEIIQKFRVQDEGGVKTLAAIDEQTQQLRKSTEGLNDKTKEAGQETEKLTAHHISARHALSMLASQTGMNTGELMHFYYAMTMIPGPMGIALGATMMLKDAFEKQREQEEKNIETHEAFMDSYGKQLLHASGRGETGTSGQYQDKVMEKNDEINKQIRERAALQSIIIQSTNDHIRIDDLNHEIEANEKLRDILNERHNLEVGNTKDQMKIDDDAYANRLKLLQGWTGEVATQKANELNSAAELADDEADVALEKYDRYGKKYGYDSPEANDALKELRTKDLAFEEAQVRQKEVLYSATEKYNKAMRESRLPHGAVDPYDKAAQIKSKYEMSNAEAANKLIEEHKRIKETVGTTTEQDAAMNKAVDERAADEKEQRRMNEEKELTEYESNKLSLAAQMQEETLRIKGDAFGAEKDQLDEWHRKELQEHREQADKINDLYRVKDADLQRRRAQDFADKSQGYQNAITSATQGGMMAQIQNLTYEHNKAQSEYKRVGTPEAAALAALEGQSYKAKIQEMQKESAHKLMGEQKVGFMDAGSAWETFSRGLNQDPFKMEQREREIEANNLLTSIDLKLGNKPVLVG